MCHVLIIFFSFKKYLFVNLLFSPEMNRVVRIKRKETEQRNRTDLTKESDEKDVFLLYVFLFKPLALLVLRSDSKNKKNKNSACIWCQTLSLVPNKITNTKTFSD